jgi:hypothetical protein
MPVEATTCDATPAGDSRPRGDHPSCPVCGGGLIPLRGNWRCGRCSFALCAGCDPSLFCPVGDPDDD